MPKHTCEASFEVNPVSGNTDAGTVINGWEHQLWAKKSSGDKTDGGCAGEKPPCKLIASFQVGLVVRPAGVPPGTGYEQIGAWKGRGYDTKALCNPWHGNDECRKGGCTWDVGPEVTDSPKPGESNSSFSVDVESVCGKDGSTKAVSVTLVSASAGKTISTTVLLKCGPCV